MPRAPVKDPLTALPGVGPKLAAKLRLLGYKKPQALADQDPEAMYARLMEHLGMHVDRCVLYVFRCAVYAAGNNNPDPELAKWWNWKDKSE